MNKYLIILKVDHEPIFIEADLIQVEDGTSGRTIFLKDPGGDTPFEIIAVVPGFALVMKVSADA